MFSGDFAGLGLVIGIRQGSTSSFRLRINPDHYVPEWCPLMPRPARFERVRVVSGTSTGRDHFVPGGHSALATGQRGAVRASLGLPFQSNFSGSWGWSGGR